MAKCYNCGKKMGMFDGGEVIIGTNKIYACNNCHSKFNRIEEIAVSDLNEAQKLLQELCDVCIDSSLKDSYKTYIDEIIQKAKKKEADAERERIALKEQEERQKLQEQREIILRESIKNMKFTTGYNFEGYKITEYKRIVSGEVVLGTGFMSEMAAGLSDFFGTTSGSFASKMSQAKKAALDNMILDTVHAGGNAIIGIDFDYITFQNNMLGVSANGTAVAIEKED